MSLSTGSLLARLVRAWRDIPRLAVQDPHNSSFMERFSGRPPHDATREWTGLSRISPFLICATVGAEDPLFFQHRGFWWRRLLAAVLRGLGGQAVGGVSTISQQLAKNLFLDDARTFRRKAAEAVLTIRLESRLNKERILELYLNLVEFGHETWGATEAAREYFDLTPSELDAFEAVFLAARLPAPRRPLEGAYLVDLTRRQRQLLVFLYASGCLSRAQERAAHTRIDAFARDPIAGLRHEQSEPRRVRLEGAPSTAQLVASGCGFAGRLAFDRLLAEWRHKRTAWATRPERWTPTVIGEPHQGSTERTPCEC